MGTVGSIIKGLDLEKWTTGAEQVRSLADTVLAISPWVLGMALGGAAIWFGTRIIRDQVAAYREGRSL